MDVGARMVPEVNGAGTSLNVRHYSALAALLIVVIHYVLYLRTEYRCIWRSPFNEVKLLYVVARYCSLASLIAHYVLIQRVLLPSGGHVTFAQCNIWFTFLSISCAVICAILNTILVLRAYALYTKNIKILAFSIPLIGQFVGAMAISLAKLLVETEDRQDRALIWGRKRRRFTPMCDMLEVPKAVIYIGAVIVIAQALLWVLTVLRRNVAEGRSTVVRLVVWEGTWACTLLCAITIALTSYSFTLRLVNPFVIFVWPICVVSITVCRLVLNMQTLNVGPPTVPADDPQAWEALTVFSMHDEASANGSLNDSRGDRHQTRSS